MKFLKFFSVGDGPTACRFKLLGPLGNDDNVKDDVRGGATPASSEGRDDVVGCLLLEGRAPPADRKGLRFPSSITSSSRIPGPVLALHLILFIPTAYL